MTKRNNLLGQNFNRLTVTGCDDTGSQLKWICTCSCGGSTKTTGYQLKTGHTKSCGCLKRERIIKLSTTHGHAKRKGRAPEYTVWASMKSRCYNKNEDGYHSYGGRGITVCDLWLNSFETFLKDIGKRPTPKHSIDRIDNDGNYEPGNVRWATKYTQDSNKSNNYNITYNGVTHPAFVWAEITGIPRNTIISRMNQLGWSAERALTTPSSKVLRKNNKILSYHGKDLPVSVWHHEPEAKALGLGYGTIKSRDRSGWSPEKIFTTPIQNKKEKQSC